MTADSTPTAAAPTKMPISAVTIGSPIATTEPNASSSTMIAIPTPISSLLGGFCASCASWPVSSTCTPPARACRGDRRGVVELRGRELVDRVGDVEVGRLAVGTHRGGLRRERIGDAGDVVPGGELRTGLVDGRRVAGVVEPARRRCGARCAPTARPGWGSGR